MGSMPPSSASNYANHTSSKQQGLQPTFQIPSSPQQDADVVELKNDANGCSSSIAREQMIGTMTKEQQKYCFAMTRSLRRHRDANPFLEPVDPVKLNIPTYPDIIKHPMDLLTLEKKLSKQQYATVDDFASDVRRIFENCYVFNGPDSVVSAMAKNLESVFNNQLKKMPMQHSSKKTQTRTSSAHQKVEEGEEEARPKRQAQASAKVAPETPADRSRRRSAKPQPADARLSFCLGLIKEMFKRQHQSYAYPFYEPVDWVTLKIPDYPKVIQHPIDLSTIKKKLETAAYKSAEEFEQDMRLMFNNCYTFNLPKSPVYTMGRQLENVFNIKWAQLPKQEPSPAHPPLKRKSGAVAGTAAGSEESEGEASHTHQIAQLEKHLEYMSQQLASMKETQKEAKRPRSRLPGSRKTERRTSLTNSGVGADRRKSHGVSKAGAKDDKSSAAAQPPHQAVVRSLSEEGDSEEILDIPFEKKRELVDAINQTSGDKLVKIVEIIRQNVDLSTEEEEIEMDLEALGVKTLSRLYRFVFGNPPKETKTLRSAASAATPQDGRDDVQAGKSVWTEPEKGLDYSTGSSVLSGSSDSESVGEGEEMKRTKPEIEVLESTIDVDEKESLQQPIQKSNTTAAVPVNTKTSKSVTAHVGAVRRREARAKPTSSLATAPSIDALVDTVTGKNKPSYKTDRKLEMQRIKEREMRAAAKNKGIDLLRQGKLMAAFERETLQDSR